MRWNRDPCRTLDDELLPRSQSSFVQKSYLMVDFFFILSGFIMVYVYGAWFEQKCSGKDFRRFFVARFARLYPLHLFTLGWCVLLKIVLQASGAMAGLSPKLQDMYNLDALPAHLLLLNAFIPGAWLTFNVPSWSISAEWYTYLIFPLLAWLAARQNMTRKILLVSLLYLGYWGIIQFAGHNFDLNVTAYGGVMRCLVGFGIGMITYAGYVRLQVWNGMGRSAWLAGAGVMTVAGMHAGISDIFIVALFPVLIFLAARNTGAMARLLDRRFFQLLGEQSYSIYMIHVPLMSTFLVGWLVFRAEKSVGVDNASALALTPAVAWSGCLVYALLVLVLSTLTFRYVESPMRQWLNQRLRVGTGPAAITRQKTPV
ncbi:MAG: acyltransferase [Lewinellaceae bacterium]|nr:acyltransferase [Lewinellaceae bacterium]